MRPLSIRLRSFRSHEDTFYEFESGATVIVGGNGEGKSSLLMGAYVALFGGPLASLLKDDGASTEMLCEFVFEHGGEEYRVRRSYSARGGGKSALDFDLADGPTWTPLTLGSQKDTQQAIEDTLGVSRETLAASAFAAQRETAVFCQMPARDRKAILAKILGLDQYGRLERVAKGKASETAVLVTRLEAVIEAAEQELAERSLFQSEAETAEALRNANSIALDDARKQLALVDEAVARWRESHASIEALREARADAVGWLDAAKFSVQRYTQRIADLRGKIDGREALAKIAGEVEARTVYAQCVRVEAEKAREQQRAWEDARRSWLDAHAAQQRAEGALELARKEEREARNHLVAADVPGAPCALCGQETHGSAHEETLRKLRGVLSMKEDACVVALDAAIAARDTLNEAERALADIGEAGPVPDVDAAERRLREALDAKAALIALDQAAVNLDDAEVDLAASEKDRAAAEVKVNGIEHRLRSVNESAPPDRQPAAARVNELEREHARLETEITTARAHLQRLARLNETNETRTTELADLRDTHDTHTALARAYGRDGIPALILETTAIPTIETETNRVLTTLDSPYRVELRTQRALKTRDTLAEALDVVIHTPSGTERLFESFSGGEQTRIAIALRIALAQLLAQNRKADVRMFTLDEPEALDTAGAEALARLAHELTDTFSTVIVIAHDERVIDLFDRVVRVERVDGTSRVALLEGVSVNG